jgi:exonuclease III
MYTFQEPPFNRHIIRDEERINILKSKAPRRHTKSKIATWNITGDLSNTLNAICAIQETKAQDIVYEEHPYGHILGFPSTSKLYGNAFAVKKNMQVYTHEHVNDRIKVISFHLNNRSNIPTARPSLLTVINAYAPHSILETTHPEEADKFFHQLQITTHKYRYSTLLFIAGD